MHINIERKRLKEICVLINDMIWQYFLFLFNESFFAKSLWKIQVKKGLYKNSLLSPSPTQLLSISLENHSVPLYTHDNDREKCDKMSGYTFFAYYLKHFTFTTLT